MAYLLRFALENLQYSSMEVTYIHKFSGALNRRQSFAASLKHRKGLYLIRWGGRLIPSRVYVFRQIRRRASLPALHSTRRRDAMHQSAWRITSVTSAAASTRCWAATKSSRERGHDRVQYRDNLCKPQGA